MLIERHQMERERKRARERENERLEREIWGRTAPWKERIRGQETEEKRANRGMGG